MCFNPCFSGCRPATFFTSFVYFSISAVSILVLVDAALRPRPNTTIAATFEVSILVLVDAALRQCLFAISTEVFIQFQSLF